MKERFPRNNLAYSKSGKLRSGGIISKNIHITPDKNNVTDRDTQNRNNVLARMLNYVYEGGNIDDILDILSNDKEINMQFEYLKKNGVNLRNAFESWYKSYVKRQQKTAKQIKKEIEDNNDYR